MFDSRQYQWDDVTLILGGRDMIGIRGIKYNEKIEREHLHAKGNQAQSIQSGNITVDGELVLLQSELQALIAAGGGSLLRIRNLSATVCYGDITNGDMMTTDIIEGIYFTESPKEMKQGDKNMEITLPFLAMRVRHNIK